MRPNGFAVPSTMTYSFPTYFVSHRNPEVQIFQGLSAALRQVQPVFELASWAFYPDGTFVFEPSQTDLPEGFFPICGTFTRSNSHIQFRGESKLGFQSSSSVSVDGLLTLTNTGACISVR